MAYTETPADMFPSMTYGASALTIPIASLTDHGLVAADCDPTTGDARAIAMALILRIDEWYRGITLDADKPTAMVPSSTLSVASTSHDYAGGAKTVVSLTGYLNRPGNDVMDEV